MIAILDYGFGNKKSLSSALDEIGIPFKVTDKIKDIKKASHIIFPGVGDFGSAIDSLKKKKILKYLKKIDIGSKSILGICLGMHLFFEGSEESKSCKGLSLMKGKIKKFTTKEISKIPNIGWYEIKSHKKKSKKINKKFYFLHSYYLEKNINTIAYMERDKKIIPAIVRKKKLIGVQFHPERSGIHGLKFLKNFYYNEL